MKFMDAKEAKFLSGYGKPPWIFKGSALYQLHLVKAETARAFIPKEFNLVEAFGYTLGGFFLAKYDDSPAGVFDELVVIAGLVWNPPTSRAWAARVLVNSEEACNHGRKDVGLPSQVAKFSKRITAVPRQREGKFSSFLNMIGIDTTLHHPKECMDVQVTEITGPVATSFCNIRLTTKAVAEFNKNSQWMGPAIKMSLPSFSGHTQYNPHLLKYSCQVNCRVRPVEPATVLLGPFPSHEDDRGQSSTHFGLETKDSSSEKLTDNARKLSISVMLSKPILALEFNCLNMRVEAPVVISHCSTRNKSETS